MRPRSRWRVWPALLALLVALAACDGRPPLLDVVGSLPVPANRTPLPTVAPIVPTPQVSPPAPPVAPTPPATGDAPAPT